MKRSFTIIELLITISIIVLMAVVAVPYFNTYSAKTELNAKAEEIKYFIETAYAEAQSPQRGSNGVVLDINLNSTDNITKTNIKFSDICYTSLIDSGCSEIEVAKNSIMSDGYSISGLTVSALTSSAKIKILTSNSNSQNIFFCDVSDCHPINNKITFGINKETGGIDPKEVTINREPFSVEIN